MKLLGSLSVLVLLSLGPVAGRAQTAPAQAPPGQPIPGETISGRPNPSRTSPVLPDGPEIVSRPTRPTALTPEQQAERDRIARLPFVNGRPYDQPSDRDKFLDYLRDSYEYPAAARATVQSLYAEARGKPTGWGQDAAGYGQRFGSAYAIQALSGSVRYGAAELFHEDLRYIPCHGCGKKAKVRNALLAEITARHGEDGHRFFTLTPTVADFSGPIIAHQLWYPGNTSGPIAGVVSARLLFATRIGSHLFEEFVLERRHNDPPARD